MIKVFAMRKFSKSVTRCVYNFISLINKKFFCTEATFKLAKLGRTHQPPREDLDAYMMRFHEKVLDCCDPIAEDVFVDVCHYGMIEDY